MGTMVSASRAMACAGPVALAGTRDRAELVGARGTERRRAELIGAGLATREGWGNTHAQERRGKRRKRRGEREVSREENLMTNFSHPPNKV
jgi:hypothetical protein